MKLSKDYLQQYRTAIFDWLVFITSMALGFAYPDLLSFISSHGFSAWMLTSLFLYVTGSWLKYLPLYRRMNLAGKLPREMPMLFFLIIGHFLIIFIVLIFAEPAARKLLWLPVDNQISGSIMIFQIAGAGFITWLVYRNRKSTGRTGKYTETFLFIRELIADIFLITSISILTFAFWEKGVMSFLGAKNPENITDIWFIFIFLGIAYLLFYLPLRYLYLVEDHSSRQTWRRMFFIFGILLLRSLLIILI